MHTGRMYTPGWGSGNTARHVYRRQGRQGHASARLAGGVCGRLSSVFMRG